MVNEREDRVVVGIHSDINRKTHVAERRKDRKWRKGRHIIIIVIMLEVVQQQSKQRQRMLDRSEDHLLKDLGARHPCYRVLVVVMS